MAHLFKLLTYVNKKQFSSLKFLYINIGDNYKRILCMIYFNKLSGEAPITTEKSTFNTKSEKSSQVKVVPVGQNPENKKAEDADTLPQGYYVEQEPQDVITAKKENTSKEDNSSSQAASEDKQKSSGNVIDKLFDNMDEAPNATVNVDERLAIDNIALGQSDLIDGALEAAQIEGINSAVADSSNKLDSAITMIKNDPHSVLNQDFEKGFHGIGLVRYQKDSYKGSIEGEFAPIEFEKTTDTKRVDFSGRYESPKGKTKLMIYASGTTTERNSTVLDSDNQDAESDNADSNGNLSLTDRLNQYSLYGGGLFKLGKDELTASIMHAKGGNLENSITTQIDLKYYINNYNATVEGNTIIYDIGTLHSTKTNFSCYFNAKDKENEINEDTKIENDEPAENIEAEDKTNEETSSDKADNKKWSKRGGLFFDGELIDGECSPGIGYYKNFKRHGKDSFLKVTPFVKGSTTPKKEESSSYHGTTGVSVLYNKDFNSNSSLSANLDVKDRVTFLGNDKGNIFTANISANYSYKNFNTKFEGMYIKVPGSRYVATGLRNSYKFNPNQKVEACVFADLRYVNQKTTSSKVKGGSIMIGAGVNF